MLETATGFDLDEYLDRIGCSGTRGASLATLEAIHLAHAQAIPFENLDPLTGRPVRLDARSLHRKMVRERRGGYCFEHNLLFGHGLTALGFEVVGLSARVSWNQPAGAIAHRGHMLLLVDLDDRAYIADVGFGALTLTAPLRLEPNLAQRTPHEPFRVLKRGGVFELQASVRQRWTPVYRFDLQEQFLPDYEVTNWYLSNHPRSHFVTGLMAARPDRDRRFTLRNAELSIHHTDGVTEGRRLTTGLDLRGVLEDLFLLTLPDAPELVSTLERIVNPRGAMEGECRQQFEKGSARSRELFAMR
jgi:N-hydroxyarylamine O-acetyltransferase